MDYPNKPISNYKKRKIISCFCLDLTATQTALLLNLNRKTINKYFNSFRQAIYHYQVHEMKRYVAGEIEVDESYFGPRRIKGRCSKKGRGTSFKKIVFGIYERQGKVFTRIIPNCKRRTLHAVMKKKIDLSAVIYSDGWKGYNGLVDVGYDKHLRINHKKNQFSNHKETHINGIESFWSFCKRRLTKFNGVKKNFPLHLKECEWRWNKSPQKLESELLQIVKVLV